jgi:hypothetical protein
MEDRETQIRTIIDSSGRVDENGWPSDGTAKGSIPSAHSAMKHNLFSANCFWSERMVEWVEEMELLGNRSEGLDGVECKARGDGT